MSIGGIASALRSGLLALVQRLKGTPQTAEPVKPVDIAMRSFLQEGNISLTLQRGFDPLMFLGPSMAYNPYLALVSAVTAAAAYNNRATLPIEDGGSPDACIRNAFVQYGFSLFQTYNYQNEGTATDCVAYGIGYRRIPGNGKGTYDLFAIIVRGTVGREWESNFRMAGEGCPIKPDHYGFITAANGVLESFDQFLKEHSNELKPARDRTKLWITGHSRGAAVANLVAHSLNQSAQVALASNIYAYTFGTPNVSTFASAYHEPNIINIANETDFVTKVPLHEGWGYGKFGITVSFNAHRTNGFLDYFGQKTQGGIQYAAFEDSKQIRKLIDSMLKIAPTVADYYRNPSGHSNVSVRSLLDMLAMYLGDKTAVRKMEFIRYWLNIRYHPIADFFLKNGTFNGERIWHAHCVETYISYAQAGYDNALAKNASEIKQTGTA